MACLQEYLFCSVRLSKLGLAVTVEYPPRVGGIASHVAELRRAMVAAGHDYRVVALFAWRPGFRRPEEQHAHVSRPFVLSAQPRALRRMLSAGPFDSHFERVGMPPSR